MIRLYIAEKLQGHVEPVRSRLYRGEKLGFSRPKYHACLLTALTGDSLKDVAAEADVSEGLLRQWRMEAEFKDQEHAIRREFVEYFVQRFGSGYSNAEMKAVFPELNNSLQEMIIMDFERGLMPSDVLWFLEGLKKIAGECADRARRDRIDINFRKRLELPSITKGSLRNLVDMLSDEKTTGDQKKFVLEIIKKSTE